MSLGNKVPVYLVNGFLESGKTTFIQETLSDPVFFRRRKDASAGLRGRRRGV